MSKHGPEVKLEVGLVQNNYWTLQNGIKHSKEECSNNIYYSVFGNELSSVIMC